MTPQEEQAEREKAAREYQNLRRQQDRLHTATCSAEIREQAADIVAMVNDRAKILLRVPADPPPLNWSTLRYVFGHKKEDRNAKKAPQA